MLAARVAAWWRCAARRRAERRVAIVLFNFPPNAGATGTAAYLAVFASLHNTMRAMRAAGYTSMCRPMRSTLRELVTGGNASRFGADANVAARIAADDHVRGSPGWRRDRAGSWGPAPGRAAERWRASSCWAAVRQRVRRAAAGLRLRGRPDAPAVRAGLCPDPRLQRVLSLDAARISPPTRCCISARMARWSSCRASRPGCPAACWPDRLIGDAAELQPVRVQQPVRGHDRQAPGQRGAAQLSDAAGGACRAVSRPAGPEILAWTAGGAWSQTPMRASDRPGRAGAGAGLPPWNWRPRSRPGPNAVAESWRLSAGRCWNWNTR